jgi:hypothetical protein
MLTPEERHLKELIEGLRTDIRGLAHALDVHMQALKGSESSREASRQQTEEARIRAIVLEQVQAEREAAEAKSKKKKWSSFEKWYFAVQSLLFTATASAFGAAWWYASIADIQKNTMITQGTTQSRALEQMQSQTDLLRKQLIAIYSSTVTCGSSGGVVSESGTVKVFCQKFGLASATAIHVSVKISRQSFPSRTTMGKPLVDTWYIARIDNTGVPTGPPMADGLADKEFYIPDFKARDWTDIQSANEVVRIEGTFSYNNGFEPVPDAAFCRIFIRADLPDPPRVDNRGRYQVQDFFSCATFNDDTRHIRELQSNASKGNNQTQTQKQ